MKDRKQFWKGIAAGFVITLALVEAAAFGRDVLTDMEAAKKAESGQLNLTGSSVEGKLEEIQTLMEAYYLEDIDTGQVEDYLYKGAVAGLGDIYAAYYTQEEYQSLIDSTSGSYTYLLDGESYSLSGSVAYSVSKGGAVIYYDNGEIDNLQQLESVTLTQLSDLYAMAGNQKYMLAETVQILLRDTSTARGYYATTLSDINDEDYTLTGWYDDLGYSAGGRIRILVAEAVES